MNSETMPSRISSAEAPLEWDVQVAINLFFKDGKRDGDLLSHDWILFALDLRTPETREDQFELPNRMDTFRTVMLKEHSIALENVRGEGYRIVPPGEQAEYASRLMMTYIDKGLRKGNENLKYIRRERLTRAEARRHTDCEVHVAALSGIMEKEKRTLFAEFPPNK